VSWDEALDFAARELLRIRAESGPAAIFHYRSGAALGALKHLSDYFFEKFGPVTVKRGDICSGAGDAAQMLDFGEEDRTTSSTCATRATSSSGGRTRSSLRRTWCRSSRMPPPRSS